MTASWRRRLTIIAALSTPVVAFAIVAGVALVLALLLGSSAGASGGCGGG